MLEGSKLEQRSVIRFLSFENRDLKPIKIYERLKGVYGNPTMNVQHVRKWCRLFCEGRVVDDEYSVRGPGGVHYYRNCCSSKVVHTTITSSVDTPYYDFSVICTLILNKIM